MNPGARTRPSSATTSAFDGVGCAGPTAVMRPFSRRTSAAWIRPFGRRARAPRSSAIPAIALSYSVQKRLQLDWINNDSSSTPRASDNVSDPAAGLPADLGQAITDQAQARVEMNIQGYAKFLTPEAIDSLRSSFPGIPPRVNRHEIDTIEGNGSEFTVGV